MQIQIHKYGFWLALAMLGTLLSTPVFADNSEPTHSPKNDSLNTKTLQSDSLLQSDSIQTAQSLRVLSWNVGEDAFVDRQTEFNTLLGHTQPDILLLDEVKPTSNETLLRAALAGADSQEDTIWHIDFGASGGRQVGVIVSRYPLEKVTEFSGKLDYPAKDYNYIVSQMSEREKTYQNWTIDDGIAANAAIVLAGDRRILAVTFDMQCCGGGPASWQEYRRRAEAREIRNLINAVLQRTKVDGIIVAGDFNIVNTPMPLVILSNLQDKAHSNLSIAEAYQYDGASWTWDGRGTKYPSRVMDFQLYSSTSLQMKSGFIFNSELLAPDEFEQLEFDTNTSIQLSDHLPLIVDYQWK